MDKPTDEDIITIHLGRVVSEDLEEAAEKFVYDWAGLSPTERRIAERAYLAGARWQKSKMLKDAVDGVMIDSLRVQIMAPLNAVIQREGLKDGDKMKILIVKEERK